MSLSLCLSFYGSVHVPSSLWSNVWKVWRQLYCFFCMSISNVLSEWVNWVSEWVSEWVTRSPIELFWRAKKDYFESIHFVSLETKISPSFFHPLHHLKMAKLNAMEFEDVWQRKNKSKRERSSYIKPTAQASRLTKKSSSKGTVQHPCDLEKFEKTTLLQNIILQSSLPNWVKLAIGCLTDWAAIW